WVGGGVAMAVAAALSVPFEERMPKF
ncbi:MAG: hypothetical protein RIR45_1333, partial [Pseudomonadota bacterium]